MLMPGRRLLCIVASVHSFVRRCRRRFANRSTVVSNVNRVTHGRRGRFNNSTHNLIRRRLRPIPTLRGIIKTSMSVEPYAAQELEPTAWQEVINNSNRELRARHRAIESGPRLEHARAAIDDLVQSNANNDKSFQTVHVIHTVDDEQLLRVGGARLGVTARQDRARRRRVDELESSQSVSERLAELLNKRFIRPDNRHAVIKVL